MKKIQKKEFPLTEHSLPTRSSNLTHQSHPQIISPIKPIQKKWNFNQVSIYPTSTIQNKPESSSKKQTTYSTETTLSLPIQRKLLDHISSPSTFFSKIAEKRTKAGQKKLAEKNNNETQLQYAREFEKKLGKYLLNNSSAKSAASQAIQKILEAISKESNSELLETFNNNDLSKNMEDFYNASLNMVPKTKQIKYKTANLFNSNRSLKKTQEKLKMPIVSGSSVKANIMFQAMKSLGNPVNLLDFRLAVLAWMLSMNSASFHDIMSVSTNYGLSYEPGLNSYRNIEPLTISELRQNVGLDQSNENIEEDQSSNGLNLRVDVQDNLSLAKLFPDEMMYQKNKDKYYLTNIFSGGYQNQTGDPWKLPSPQNEQQEKNLEKFELTGSLPGAAAIRTYALQSYLLQNAVMSNYPEWLQKQIIKYQISHSEEMDILKKHYQAQEINIDDIHQEAKLHNNMLQNALQDVPNWKGIVYRGESSRFIWNKYKTGDTVTFNKFTSTSQNEETAEDFLLKSRLQHPKNRLIKIKMIIKFGRDINMLSSYNEQEVLLPPGAKFKVIERTLQKPNKILKTKLQDENDPNYNQDQNDYNKQKIDLIGESEILCVTLEQESGGKYEKEHPEHKEFNQRLDEKGKKESRNSWLPFLSSPSSSQPELILPNSINFGDKQ